MGRRRAGSQLFYGTPSGRVAVVVHMSR
eukprot:SAG31_NODE_20358_length_576_cov_28.090147_2_plen_27_part_01